MIGQLVWPNKALHSDAVNRARDHGRYLLKGIMERIDITFTIAERDLIVNQTFAVDDLTERLHKAKVEGKYITVSYTLDEIEDLAGFIAAEANHAEDKKLEKKLDALYDKISDIEDKYL